MSQSTSNEALKARIAELQELLDPSGIQSLSTEVEERRARVAEMEALLQVKFDEARQLCDKEMRKERKMEVEELKKRIDGLVKENSKLRVMVYEENARYMNAERRVKELKGTLDVFHNREYFDHYWGQDVDEEEIKAEMRNSFLNHEALLTKLNSMQQRTKSVLNESNEEVKCPTEENESLRDELEKEKKKIEGLEEEARRFRNLLNTQGIEMAKCEEYLAVLRRNEAKMLTVIESLEADAFKLQETGKFLGEELTKLLDEKEKMLEDESDDEEEDDEEEDDEDEAEDEESEDGDSDDEEEVTELRSKVTRLALDVQTLLDCKYQWKREQKSQEAEMDELKKKVLDAESKVRALEKELEEKKETLEYEEESNYSRAVNYSRVTDKLKKRALIAENRCYKLSRKIEHMKYHDGIFSELKEDTINKLKSQLEDKQFEQQKLEIMLAEEKHDLKTLKAEFERAAAQYDEECEEKREVCKKLEEKVAKYSGKVAKLRAENKVLQGKIDAWRENWKVMHQKQNSLNEDLAVAHRKNRHYKVEMDQLRTDQTLLLDELAVAKRESLRNAQINTELQAEIVKLENLGVEEIVTDDEEPEEPEEHEDNEQSFDNVEGPANW